MHKPTVPAAPEELPTVEACSSCSISGPGTRYRGTAHQRRRLSPAPALVSIAVLAVAFVMFFLPQPRASDAGSSPTPATTSPQAPGSAAVPPVPTEHGVVSHLVDGDTLDVTLNGARTRIRLLNVDTPETVRHNTPVQCMGPEASARLRQLAPIGSIVGLAFDVERLDKYGRTLATLVTPSGQNASEVLAQEGLGRAVRYGANEAGYAIVVAAVKRAQAANLGMWSRACG